VNRGERERALQKLRNQIRDHSSIEEGKKESLVHVILPPTSSSAWEREMELRANLRLGV
jgi:hypothetical protein